MERRATVVCMYRYSLTKTESPTTEERSLRFLSAWLFIMLRARCRCSVLALFKPVFELRQLACRSGFDSPMAWLVAIESCENRSIESRVKAGVVPKFCQSQVLVPLVWVGVGEASKVNLQALIDMLHLPVCLRVIWRAHIELGTDSLEELAPKNAGERGVSIRDYCFREAV